MPTDYIDEGDPVHMCEYCSALLWYNERIERYKDRDGLQFAPCCSNGKIKVPLLKKPPPLFRSLFFNKNTNDSRNFLSNIRAYNNMFSFTSMGGKIDTTINARGKGP